MTRRTVYLVGELAEEVDQVSICCESILECIEDRFRSTCTSLSAIPITHNLAASRSVESFNGLVTLGSPYPTS